MYVSTKRFSSHQNKQTLWGCWDDIKSNVWRNFDSAQHIHCTLTQTKPIEFSDADVSSYPTVVNHIQTHTHSSIAVSHWYWKPRIFILFQTIPIKVSMIQLEWFEWILRLKQIIKRKIKLSHHRPVSRSQICSKAI